LEDNADRAVDEEHDRSREEKGAEPFTYALRPDPLMSWGRE